MTEVSNQLNFISRTLAQDQAGRRQDELASQNLRLQGVQVDNQNRLAMARNNVDLAKMQRENFNNEVVTGRDAILTHPGLSDEQKKRMLQMFPDEVQNLAFQRKLWAQGVNSAYQAHQQRAIQQKEADRQYALEEQRADAYSYGQSNPRATAPDSMAATLASQVIDGRLDPNMISKRGGLQQKVFAMVEDLAPGFNIVGAHANARFATNPGNLQSRALINGVEPLYEKLLTTGEDLGNTSIPGVNRIINWAKLETGDPKIVAFNNLRDDVIAETERILMGSGVLSDSKYQRALKNVNSAQSYPQLKSAVNQLRNVVSARLEALDKKPFQNVNPNAGGAANNNTSAPPQAVEYLKQHPELKNEFQQKYGYIPEGF